MASSYSQDLRDRVIDAVEKQGMSRLLGLGEGGPVFTKCGTASCDPVSARSPN